MGFVANFIRFPAVQNFENWLRFDKVTESLKVGTFLRHSVDALIRSSAIGPIGWEIKVLCSVYIHMTAAS